MRDHRGVERGNVLRSTIRRFLFAGLLLGMFSASGSALAQVNLVLDGAPVPSDVLPVIVQDRTLVPVRALFEAMGADVDWDPQTRQVLVSYSETEVVLTVDDPVASVNGQEKRMEVPAAILAGGRAFIPVRFVAEALGFFVDWDPEGRNVIVESDRSGDTLVEDISLLEETGAFGAAVSFSGAEPSWRTAAYEDPDRFVVDIQNARMRVAACEGGSGSIPAGNAVFSRIRFSQFDADTVRIVFDLNRRQTGTLTAEAAEGLLHINFSDPDAPAGPTGEPHPEEADGEESPGQDIPIPSLDWRVADQLVVIDAGHGGKDPGCLVVHGGTTYHEKDFNLAIALALDAYLKEAGARTCLLRTADQTLALQDRPVLANEAGADLFVSIHNNSSTTSVPKGTQVFYYAKPSEEAYILSSKTLARGIMDEFLLHVGLGDRGIQSQGAYAVLNKTRMPAVIVEGGFFSNSEDREVMLQPDYPDRYARTVARAVVLCLNQAAEEQEDSR